MEEETKKNLDVSMTFQTVTILARKGAQTHKSAQVTDAVTGETLVQPGMG